MKKFTLLLVIAISFSSCFNNYFKVNTESEWKEDQLKNLANSEKKIIVHFRNSVKLLANPVFGADHVSGKLETFYAVTPRYMDPNTEEKKNFKYKYKDRKDLFSEIHVYVNDDFTGQTEYDVTKTNFAKSNIYTPNKGLSIASHALGITIILGVTTAALAAATVAAGTYMVTSAVYAFNCPQAYVEVYPGQYQFIGGLFTGSVDQHLQRTDMVPLPALSSSDTIRVRIKGMQNETQYMDFADIKQVTHPEGTEVVGNRQGDLFIIRHLKMPNEIRAGALVDRSKTLLFRDGQNYGFHLTDSSDQSHIQLKFARKENDKKAVLVARMKNSTWGGYITSELKRSSANPLAMEAGYNTTLTSTAMRISVMTKNGWKAVDYFPPAGNTATRDLAMEIDLSEVDGKDVIVKMEAPYRFWDLDHVGLSYEIFKPSDVSSLCRVSATVDGKNFSGSIDREDGLYLALESTDHVELEYIIRPSNTPGTISSYLLVAGGYYHLKPQNTLTQTQPLRFSESTSLNKYSITKYKELGFEY